MSFVSPLWAISAMNLTASIVFFESSVGWFASFWMKLPKHIMNAIRAMFESSSCDCPIPIGWPAAFSFGAAALTWSQVAGDSPTPFQRLCRQTTGSGTYASETAKYFFVFGLYVDDCAIGRYLPTFASTAWMIEAWLITWSSYEAIG